MLLVLLKAYHILWKLSYIRLWYNICCYLCCFVPEAKRAWNVQWCLIIQISCHWHVIVFSDIQIVWIYPSYWSFPSMVASWSWHDVSYQKKILIVALWAMENNRYYFIRLKYWFTQKCQLCYYLPCLLRLLLRWEIEQDSVSRRTKCKARHIQKQATAVTTYPDMYVRYYKYMISVDIVYSTR